MKAILFTEYGSPDVLQYKDVEKPAPADDEVLIKVLAASANPADWHIMRGAPFLARLEFGLWKPKNPTLGADVAGIIEAVGKNVTQFQVGDEVFGEIFKGSFAEYVCASEKLFAAKPANTSFEAAAAVPVAALTALQGLRDKGQIRSGQKVLINGASGGVGTFAVQIAKSYGTEVTGVCSTRNLDLVRSIGADHVIDYTKEDFTENGKTYDLIFDTIGKRSFLESKGSLTDKGIYLATVPTPVMLLQVLWTAKSGGQKVKFVAAGLRPAKEKIKDLVFLTKLIGAGKLKPVIDRCYPLEQMAEAHRYVEQGHKKGNVVITVGFPLENYSKPKHAQ